MIHSPDADARCVHCHQPVKYGDCGPVDDNYAATKWLHFACEEAYKEQQRREGER